VYIETHAVKAAKQPLTFW